MKMSTDKKRFKFYLWVGLAYLILAFLSSHGEFPGKFPQLFVNNIWAVIYVVVLNFLLFEYTVPYVLRKRRTVIYNILLGILLLQVFLMLASFGSYLWRSLGIELHIYTALKVYPSLDELLQNQMGYSTGSVVVFGVSRHVYNYQKLRQAAQQLRIEKQQAELSYL